MSFIETRLPIAGPLWMLGEGLGEVDKLPFGRFEGIVIATFLPLQSSGDHPRIVIAHVVCTSPSGICRVIEDSLFNIVILLEKW